MQLSRAHRRSARRRPDTENGSVPHVSGAEALVRMLALHEVEVLFGLCGDTSLPFYDALRQVDHPIRHVLCRDERSQATWRDGYAG